MEQTFEWPNMLKGTCDRYREDGAFERSTYVKGDFKPSVDAEPGQTIYMSFRASINGVVAGTLKRVGFEIDAPRADTGKTDYLGCWLMANQLSKADDGTLYFEGICSASITRSYGLLLTKPKYKVVITVQQNGSTKIKVAKGGHIAIDHLMLTVGGGSFHAWAPAEGEVWPDNLLVGSWDLSTVTWGDKAKRSDERFHGAAVADLGAGQWGISFTTGSHRADARVTSGAEYVLSFWARADVAGDKIHSEVWGSLYTLDTELTTEWQQVVMPYGIVNADQRDVYFWGLGTNSGSVHVALPMCVLGTEPATWAPAEGETLAGGVLS